MKQKRSLLGQKQAGNKPKTEPTEDIFNVFLNLMRVF